MARSHNESLLRLMQEYPERFWGPRWCRCRMSPALSAKWSGLKRTAFAPSSWTKCFRLRIIPTATLGEPPRAWPFFKRAEELSMPIYLHNVQHGHRISNLLDLPARRVYIFAPQEGQMSLVSLIHQRPAGRISQVCSLFLLKPARRLSNRWCSGSIKSWNGRPWIMTIRKTR